MGGGFIQGFLTRDLCHEAFKDNMGFGIGQIGKHLVKLTFINPTKLHSKAEHCKVFVKLFNCHTRVFYIHHRKKTKGKSFIFQQLEITKTLPERKSAITIY